MDRARGNPRGAGAGQPVPIRAGRRPREDGSRRGGGDGARAVPILGPRHLRTADADVPPPDRGPGRRHGEILPVRAGTAPGETIPGAVGRRKRATVAGCANRRTPGEPSRGRPRSAADTRSPREETGGADSRDGPEGPGTRLSGGRFGRARGEPTAPRATSGPSALHGRGAAGTGTGEHRAAIARRSRHGTAGASTKDGPSRPRGRLADPRPRRNRRAHGLRAKPRAARRNRIRRLPESPGMDTPAPCHARTGGRQANVLRGVSAARRSGDRIGLQQASAGCSPEPTLPPRRRSHRYVPKLWRGRRGPPSSDSSNHPRTAFAARPPDSRFAGSRGGRAAARDPPSRRGERDGG